MNYTGGRDLALGGDAGCPCVPLDRCRPLTRPKRGDGDPSSPGGSKLWPMATADFINKVLLERHHPCCFTQAHFRLWLLVYYRGRVE